MSEKITEIDPRDWLFGAMLSSNIGQQFEIFHLIKQQWFSINYHRNLYDCFRYHVDNGIECNILTANTWFKENGKFTTNFKTSDISQLTSRVGYPEPKTLTSCINESAYIYFKESSTNFYNKIGTNLNSGNFNLNQLTADIDSFQKIIDEDYIEESEPSNVDIIYDVVSTHDSAKNGNVDGIKLGFRSLNHIILEPVDFMVIGARPSMGKTAFMMSSIYIQVFLLRLPVVIFSLEMSRKQMMRRLISIHTKIPDERIKLGQCTPEEIDKINAFKTHPALGLLTIYEGTHKPSDIIRKTSILNKKVPLSCVWVDYLQKMSDERKGMKKLESVSDASNQLKNLSMSLKIPTIALAQLSRSVEQRGGEKRPVLSDLRESGEIEQDASIVCFLHRPEYYGMTHDENGESLEGMGEVITAKNRGSKIGINKLGFQGELMEWHDPIVEYANSGGAIQSFTSRKEHIQADMPF